MRSPRIRLLALGGLAAAAALAAVLAALALGGRETATRAEYRAEVQAARDRVEYALIRITRSDSVDELIERIDEAAATVEATADDLEGAPVARGFGPEHERLVDRLHAFAGELRATADQFRDPTLGPALSGITSLGFQEWENVNKALARMRAKGLRVQLLQRH